MDDTFEIKGRLNHRFLLDLVERYEALNFLFFIIFVNRDSRESRSSFFILSVVRIYSLNIR